MAKHAAELGGADPNKAQGPKGANWLIGTPRLFVKKTFEKEIEGLPQDFLWYPGAPWAPGETS